MASKRLPRSVYAAINRTVTPEFGRWAKKTYGIGGKRLLAKVAAVEGGGTSRKPNISSAQARGPFQFIPSTRAAYVKQYGVDPWKDDVSAAKAAMIHLKGTGIRGYNPGLGAYESMVLGAKVDTEPLKTGRYGSGKVKSGSRRSSLGLKSSTVPGVDNSASRDQIKLSYLSPSRMPSQEDLLQMAGQLSGARDVPEATETRLVRRKGSQGRVRGDSPVLAETANRTAGQMLNLALKVDRKAPAYRWGGGHGLKPAQIGELVDCSGFVSQILGVSPRVSGDFARWGKPGPGKFVTVYANKGHVLMSMRDPRTGKTRWFGTSRQNPGGGAGEIKPPSAGYLKNFTARHPGRKRGR